LGNHQQKMPHAIGKICRWHRMRAVSFTRSPIFPRIAVLPRLT
jgi:hypothetical protein